MKEAEENAFTKPETEANFAEAPNDIVQLVWGQHLGLRNQMPKEWLVENTSVDMRVKLEHEGISWDAMYTVKFSEPMLCPPGFSRYRHDVYIEEDAYPPMAATVKYAREMMEIKARWEKVKLQITTFLQSCKSLNEALKLWPAVSVYIPKQYLDRVNRKVEREVKASAAQQALASVDTDAAIAAATTARFMSTAQGTFNV
jgi:hypothetical protein